MTVEQLEIISKLVTIAVGAVTLAKTYLEVKALLLKRQRRRRPKK